MTRSDARSSRAEACSRLAALVVGTLLLLLAPAAASAQRSLAQRMAEVRGEAELHFAARPGVCGYAEGGISFVSPGDDVSSVRGDERYDHCERGPVRVRLAVSDGKVKRVRTWVGRSRDAVDLVTDLGAVGAREAAAWFLELARTADEDVARKALVPAALADSVTVGPELIELARDRSRPTVVRREALFWVGMGETPTSELLTLYGEFSEREMKERTIFVISQRDDSAAVDGLMVIAQNEPDRALRRKAFFWLGQKDDPRVVQLLTSILEK